MTEDKQKRSERWAAWYAKNRQRKIAYSKAYYRDVRDGKRRVTPKEPRGTK